MDKDWQVIESLFHEALALKAAEREVYIARACVGNESLRQEVESLIATFEEQNGFMEQPAFSLGLQVLSCDSTGELRAHQEIGPYKVLRKIGEGGMGKVYLAEDTQLNRNVALKFLPSGLANDQWAKRQLIKEAQAVAMLDHPNICAIHRFEVVGDYSFIVMQYVEGETLDDLLRSRSLDLGQRLDLAAQIATALSEAHAHGIIHRDVKPQNIMVTANGQLKMLDFGLAKLVQQKQSMVSAEDHPSHTSQLGFIPGTVSYMSPEQLRAERLDYRSDIFSFGTVLYEMMSGKNPHARASKAETISAVLNNQPPPLRDSAPEIPRELDRIAHKCLEKDKDRRYQSASEILYDLNNLQKSRRNGTHWLQYFSLRAAVTLALILLLIAVSAFVYLRLTRVPTLAVLPIVNASGDTSVEYLGFGLTENLINKLSRLSKLHVKPLTSVSGYKDKQINPQVVGREMNVDAVFVGTIVRQGESLVLQTRLVNTADGSQIWAGQYNIKMEEIFSIQEDVSEHIVSKLELWLGKKEKDLLARRGSENPEAFREYMLGRYYWRNRDTDNISTAIEHFNAAIKLDPVYAQAHAGLADCYVLLNMVSYGHMETREAMMKAEAAAKQALYLDDTLPEAHTSIGIVSLRAHWNWQGAEREFKRAIELDPEYAPAHYWYSNLLAITGRHDESIYESERSRDLDPFSPAATMNFCRMRYNARQYDQAAVCFDKLINEQPDYTNGKYARGYVYLQQGMYQDALEIFERLYEGGEENKALAGAPLGYTYGITGRRNNALKVLSDMQDLSKHTYIPPQEFALIYLGLGDIDNALTWLQKAAEERFASFTYVAVDPMFDKLRSDPRFIALLQRYNLPSQSPPK